MLVGQHPARRPGKNLSSVSHKSEALANRGLAELAALKLVLTGESVVDLPRLWFSERASVDDFLRLSGFDTDNPLDLNRLHELHHEATVYLTEVHRYRLPLQIEQPKDIHELFLAASAEMSRLQRFACMTLKVMHILHHITGRELLFNTPISEAQLFERLNTKVFTVIDRMRASGIGVQEFAAGKKSRSSLATKLLAKRNNLATHIFDKLRFRIIVSTRDDLVLALLYLLRHLLPFNYVLPEQSQNNIVTIEDLVRVLELTPEQASRYWGTSALQAVATGTEQSVVNEFTARSYRCVNFVADIPMRIDDVAAAGAAPAVAFVLTEIQLVDSETARANERGDSAHSLYKKRQRARVRARLEDLYRGRAEPPDSSMALEQDADLPDDEF